MSEAFRYRAPAAALDVPVDSHAVIEASAGTGKTYLLEHRVVHLLLRGDTTLERILVVTFTERATAELRARVRGLIERLLELDEHSAEPDDPHWVIDDVAKTTLRAALASFDGAPIHTIHGFCQRVLTDNAFANRRLFEQRQVDRASVFHDAFMDAVRTDWACDASLTPYLRAWLNSRSLAALESRLFALSERGDDINPTFDEDETAARLRALPAVPTGAELDSWLDAVAVELKAAGVRAQTVTATRKKLATVAPIAARFRTNENLLETLGALEERAGELRYLNEKLSSLSIAPEGAAAADQARALAAGLAECAVPQTAAIFQRLGPAVAARLAAIKRREGLFDFKDMLDLVWESLEGERGTELCSALRSRYDFALIDEFQDTDEVQWQIFRRVFLDSDGRNRLTIIGDPKQAIYSFRGADVATYLRARREMLARGAQRVALRDNYRSTADVVAAYNAILEQETSLFEGGGQPFFTGEIRYDEPVVAASGLRALSSPNADASAPTAAVLLEVPAPPPPPVAPGKKPKRAKKLTADDLKLALGPAIADECRRLLSGDEPLALADRDGQRRELVASDIFVLTRSSQETKQMAGYLRAAGVPCSLYKQDGLMKTAEASDIRDLLAAIARPQSLPERLRCWQTPFFAVPLAELVHAADLPETHPLIGRLLDWKQLADRLDYDRLFDSLLCDSGLARRELLLRAGERELTNYQHIFELLLEDTRAARRSLPELIERLESYIDGLRAPPGEDGDVQRVDGDRAAVQVMTMHKSKGLEAAVVFLFGGFFKPIGDAGMAAFHRDDGSRVIQVGPASPEDRDAINRDAEEEDQRLLYVALTRARARLYLPCASAGAASITGAYKHVNQQLERVSKSSEHLFARRLVERDSGPRLRVVGDAGNEAGELSVADVARFQPTSVLDNKRASEAALAARESLRLARRGPTVTSYTRLKHGERPTSAAVEPEELKGSADAGNARPGDDELPGGREAGVFLHHVLEHVPADSFSERPGFDDWRELAPVASLVTESLARFDQPAGCRGHVERMVYDCAMATMAIADHVVPGLYTCTGRREVEFLYPLASSAGATDPTATAGDSNYVKGFIDYLFEYEGRLFAVDWKTDVLDDYGPEALAVHADQAYGVQARLYLLALARMLDVRNPRHIRERLGGIAFVFTRGLAADASDRAPGTGVVSVTPSWDDLQRWQLEFGDRIERARGEVRP